jgi:hypothetical protein
MVVDLIRYNSNEDYTDGIIFIDGVFECYTIEDEKRSVKVWGETRIPNGIYNIDLRKEGSFHKRYTKKFPELHKGMLCVHNADNWKVVNNGMEFQYILIHIGNTDKNTAGCLLVGNTANANKGFIGDSTGAYKALYEIISDALICGEDVILNVREI